MTRISSEHMFGMLSMRCPQRAQWAGLGGYLAARWEYFPLPAPLVLQQGLFADFTCLQAYTLVHVLYQWCLPTHSVSDSVYTSYSTRQSTSATVQLLHSVSCRGKIFWLKNRKGASIIGIKGAKQLVLHRCYTTEGVCSSNQNGEMVRSRFTIKLLGVPNLSSLD